MNLARTKCEGSTGGDGRDQPVDAQGLALGGIDHHPVPIDHGGDGRVYRDVGARKSGSCLYHDWVGVCRTAGFDEDEFATALHVIDQPVGGDVVRVSPRVATFDLFIVENRANRL